MIKILKANFWLLLALAVGFNFGMFVTLRLKPNPEQLWAFFGSVSGTVVALLGALAFYQFQRRDRFDNDFRSAMEHLKLLRVAIESARSEIPFCKSRNDAETHMLIVLRRARAIDNLVDRLDPSSLAALRVATTVDFIAPETIEDQMTRSDLGDGWRERWLTDLSMLLDNIRKIESAAVEHSDAEDLMKRLKA